MPRRERDWGSSRRVVGVEGSPLRKEIVTHAHEPGKVYARMYQPDRKVILERNQRLRNTPGAVKDLSFGRFLASIPLEDYYRLQREHPELRSGDAKVRSQKMLALLRDPENRKFLVQE